MPRDTGEGTDRDKVVTKATHNAGIFLSRDTYLTAVLHSSQDQDLYVRFHAIQLAMKLLSRSRGPTQDAVLNQPTTVGHVLDLANDSREIVRNEVLLLLAALSEGSAALQNILAFQGAFEQLLGIIETERDGAANADGAGGGRGSSGSLTGADGGGGGGSGGFGSVIIHDCLQIMCRLLESNSSACRFFRESGALARVPALLRLPPNHTKGHATSARLTCELLSRLIAHGEEAELSADGVEDAGEAAQGVQVRAAGSGEAPEDDGAAAQLRADISATQDALLRLRVLPLLLTLATDPATATDAALRLQALGTIGDFARGHTGCAAELLASKVTRRHQDMSVREPALHRILYAGLRSSSAAVRMTTWHVFQCVLEGNRNAQLAAAAALKSGALPSAASSPALAAAPAAEPLASCPLQRPRRRVARALFPSNVGTRGRGEGGGAATGGWFGGSESAAWRCGCQRRACSVSGE